MEPDERLFSPTASTGAPRARYDLCQMVGKKSVTSRLAVNHLSADSLDTGPVRTTRKPPTIRHLSFVAHAQTRNRPWGRLPT